MPADGIGTPPKAAALPQPFMCTCVHCCSVLGRWLAARTSAQRQGRASRRAQAAALVSTCLANIASCMLRMELRHEDAIFACTWVSCDRLST